MNHYCQFWPQACRPYACGAVNDSAGMHIPSDVTCPACQKTSIWKEDSTTIEIGFDGDEHAWFAAVKKPGRESI